MKVRFYFDYSDYRSYLMLTALDVIRRLPVQVQWIAVDAFSLRALSGAATPATRAEREWLRQEAVRFARSNAFPFRWREDALHSGHALRAGIWLMQNAPDRIEAFSRKMLQTIWADGAQPDYPLVRNTLLETIGDPDTVDSAFADTASRDQFLYQDACLQQALNDGVFDVATIAFGKRLFCRFDQLQDLERELLSAILENLPQSSLLNACVSFLLSLDTGRRSEQLHTLLLPEESPASSNSPSPDFTVYRTTTPTTATWHIPRKLPSTALTVCCTPAPGDRPDELSRFLALAPECSLSVIPHDIPLTVTAPAKFHRLLSTAPDGRHFIARTKTPSEYLYFCTGPDAGTMVIGQNHPRFFFHISDWIVVAFASGASRDLHSARHGAYRSAAAMIRLASGPDDLSSEAWAVASNTWIIELQNSRAAVIDADARRLPLLPASPCTLSPSMRHMQAPAWFAPDPRTLLLCDHAFSVGSISDGADLELASINQNLEVSTALQKSELSGSRTSERLRIGEDLIQIIPLSGDQVCVTELVTHKFLDTLNKAHAESIPILVNYWSDLEFDMLEILRPVQAALCALWHVPLVVVVMNQVTDVWLCSVQGVPYRIEKDGLSYTIDLSEAPNAEQCLQRMLDSIGSNEKDFLDMLNNQLRPAQQGTAQKS